MEYAIEIEGLTKIFQPGIGFYDLFIRPRQSLKKFKYPDAGTVRVNGYNAVSDDINVKRSIGMLINDER